MQNKQGTETCTSIEGCTNENTTGDEDCKNNNASVDNKQDTNSCNHPCNKHISINYFHSLNNIDAYKRSSMHYREPFKEELKCLQEMDIIMPLGVDETSECCNSFVLVPKANGKVRLCLDPAWLNQVLFRPVHRVQN